MRPSSVEPTIATVSRPGTSLRILAILKPFSRDGLLSSQRLDLSTCLGIRKPVPDDRLVGLSPSVESLIVTLLRRFLTFLECLAAGTVIRNVLLHSIFGGLFWTCSLLS